MPFLPSSKKGIGYVPDVKDNRDISFFKTFGANVVKAESGSRITSLRNIAPILNQGAVNDCVAEAISTAIYIRERLVGANPKPISRRALYYYARLKIGRQTVDAGCRPRDAIKILTQNGICLEEECPHSQFVLTVNSTPPGTALITGRQRAGGKYVRFTQRGDDLIQALRDSFANGIPVPAGFQIGRELFEAKGLQILGPPKGAIVGGHMMCMVADDPARECIVTQNSHGQDKGDGGYLYLSYDYVTSQFAGDMYGIDGWKAIQNATGRSV